MINRKRLLQTFLDLVKINSPTYKEKDVAAYILKTLKTIGAEAFTDDSYLVTGCNVGNVIARVEGKVNTKPVMLNAHMDTIEPTKDIKINVEEKIVRTDGSTILGGDCRAGIAIILEVLQVLKESDIIHGPIEVVFTAAEEKGLSGSKNLDLSKIKSKDCFVLDCGGPAGLIINAAPSQKNIKMVFYGKAAHAGVEPQNGINAIQAASLAISKMNLGRIDEETTANVGVIKGGKATNIIPSECELLAEARSHNEGKLNKTIEDMINIAEDTANQLKAKVKVDVESLYKGFNMDKNETVIRVANQAAKETGLEPSLIFSGGGFDANVFNDNGISAVSLGMGIEKCHSTEEYLVLDEFYKAAALAVKIVEIYPGENL